MPYYLYKAKDSEGQLISGTLEAETRTSAVSRLQVMGYFPIDIKSEQREEAETGIGGALRKVGSHRGRIRSRELTTFYREMSDLVGAGVPLVKSLAIVKGQTTNDALKAMLSQVDQDVQGGDTFARALERHPKVFNKLSTALIHAGEVGGLLEETLARLADFAEAEQEIRSKIQGALAYPVIMTAAGSLAILVLITFVIPKIVTIFEELNQTLPLITQILIAISGFFGSYWYAIAGAGIAFFFAVRRYVQTEVGRAQFDRVALAVPILGEVVLKRQIAQFTRTLGALLRNGVPILTALEISNEVLTNVLIRRDVEKLPEGISQGGGMAQTLRQSDFFPPVTTNMIAIGEETGNLPGVLLKVATTYEKQVDRSVKALTSVIEPLIILVMGLVVGFIVISMLLPIFSLDPTGG